MVERSSPRGTWLTVFLPSRASQAGVAPPIPAARSRKVDGDNSPTSAGRESSREAPLRTCHGLPTAGFGSLLT